MHETEGSAIANVHHFISFYIEASFSEGRWPETRKLPTDTTLENFAGAGKWFLLFSEEASSMLA